MGRAARAPGHAKRVTPLHRKNPVLGERTACPPCTILGTGPARSEKRDVPHDFSAQSRQRRDFRAGHGLEFNRLFTYLAKSEGGQEDSSCPLHFCRRPSLRPGSKAFMRTKHRPETKSSRSLHHFSAERGGRSGARPGAPTMESPFNRAYDNLPKSEAPRRQLLGPKKRKVAKRKIGC